MSTRNVTLDLDEETDDWVQWATRRGENPSRLRIRSWNASYVARLLIRQVDLRAYRGDMELWRARDDALRATDRLQRLLRDRERRSA